MTRCLPCLCLALLTAAPAAAQVRFTAPGGPATLQNGTRANPLTAHFPAPNPAHQATGEGFAVIADHTLTLNESPDAVALTDSRPFRVGPEPAAVRVNLLAVGRLIRAGVAPDPSVEFEAAARIVGQTSGAERALGPLRGTGETAFNLNASSAPLTLPPGSYRLELQAVWRARASALPAQIRSRLVGGRIEASLTPVLAPNVDGVFQGAAEGWIQVAEDAKEVRSEAAGPEPRPWPIRVYSGCDDSHFSVALVHPNVRPNVAGMGLVSVGRFRLLWDTGGGPAPDAELLVDVPAFSPNGGSGAAEHLGLLTIGGTSIPLTGDRAVKNGVTAPGQMSVVEYRAPRALLAGLEFLPFTYDSEGQGEEGARNLGIGASAFADSLDLAALLPTDYLLSPCNRPPDAAAAAPSVAVLSPIDGDLVPVEILGVTDPDGDPLTVEITAIMQDEPVSGGSAGSAQPDARGVGGTTALLRAERMEGGNGRVYTIFFRARDPRGAHASGSVQVGVPLRDGGRARDDGPLYDSTSGGS
jgi:hypothetical protein